MGAWVLAPSLGVTTLVCCWLFHRIAGFRKRSVVVVLATILGWIITFSCVFMVPYDVLSTEILATQPSCMVDSDDAGLMLRGAEGGGENEAWDIKGNALWRATSGLLGVGRGEDTDSAGCDPPAPVVPYKVMVITWGILYWTAFFGTWLIYPLLISYVDMADFHFSERITATIKENIAIYGIMGAIAGIAALVLAVKNSLNFQGLVGIAIVLSNASGLLALVMLLGYGLIAVPRKIWRRSNQSLLLKQYHFKVITHHQAKEEAASNLNKTLKLVRSASEKVTSIHPYRPYVDQVIAECIPYGYDRFRVGEGDADVSSYDQIVRLRHKVRASIRQKLCTEVIYKMHVKKCLELEDVLACRDAAANASNHRIGVEMANLGSDISADPVAMDYRHVQGTGGHAPRRIPWCTRPRRLYPGARLIDSLEYYWKVYLQEMCYKGLAILCALLSILTMWSELTFWTVKINGPDMSIFSLLLDLNSKNVLAQLVICAPLIYMAFCSFYSLFKLKIFNLFRIKKYQQTDDRSLLFSAAWLARLIPPLSYNFLSIVHRYDGTAFSLVMGSMDIAMQWFNFVMSLCIIFLCVVTYLNVYERLLALLRIKRFHFKDDFHDEQIDEGASHVRRARQKLDEGVGGFDKTVEHFDPELERTDRPHFQSKHRPRSRDDVPLESVESLLEDVDGTSFSDLRNRPPVQSEGALATGRRQSEKIRRRSSSLERTPSDSGEEPPGMVSSWLGSLSTVFKPSGENSASPVPFDRPSFVDSRASDLGRSSNVYIFSDEDFDQNTTSTLADDPWEEDTVKVEI